MFEVVASCLNVLSSVWRNKIVISSESDVDSLLIAWAVCPSQKMVIIIIIIHTRTAKKKLN